MKNVFDFYCLLQLLVDEYLQCWMTPPNYTLFLTVSVFLVIFIGFPPAVFVTTVIEWFPDLYEKTRNVFQGYSILANLFFALVSGYVILASSVPNHSSAGSVSLSRSFPIMASFIGFFFVQKFGRAVFPKIKFWKIQNPKYGKIQMNETNILLN